MGIWVDVAQLVAGAAAVVAILFGVYERRRQEYGAKVDNAAKVTAWRAYAEAEGVTEPIPGVVVENASSEVALQVDIKVGLLIEEKDKGFISRPDGSKTGLRIPVLPSGTWFIPYGDDVWKAQIEVEVGSGARWVSIPELEKRGATRTKRQIFPLAKIDKSAPAVHFLRFNLGEMRWWRDEQGVLHEDANRRRMWRSLRKRSSNKWDTEFKASAQTPCVEVTALADFSKYTWDKDAKSRGKFDTVNLIAGWWAKKENLHTVAEFERRFGEELQKAVPAQAAKFEAGKLLSDTTTSVPKDEKPKTLTIELDSKKYGVKWHCGFKRGPDVGRTVHKPIIDYFVAQYDAPAHPVE